MLGEEQELIYGGGTKILCLLSHTFLSHSHIHSLSFFSPTFIVFHSHLTFSLSHSHALSPLSTRTNPFSLFVTCLQISALTVIIDTIQDYVIYMYICIYIQNNLKLHNLGKNASKFIYRGCRISFRPSLTLTLIFFFFFFIFLQISFPLLLTLSLV